MNAIDPPFDPPYVTTLRTTEGVSRIETLIDGTTRLVSRPAVDIGKLSAAPGGANSRAVGEKPAPAAANSARVFLKVPFAEKDTAKSMGARWDASRKKWYVPQGLDPALFSRWNADVKA